MRVFVTGGSGFVGRGLIQALAQRGDTVVALARSDGAERAVREAGAAAAARGDLDDEAALVRGLEGCERVFHAAAKVEDWGRRADFLRINVEGTQRVLAAARQVKARRFVHIGTEAAFVDGGPLAGLDETRPLPSRNIGLYPETKALAERAVVAASGVGGLETVVVRPRFIWGKGDTSLLPKIAAAARSGKLRWIGGGRYTTSTCHVDNVCEGAIAAAERGRSGAAYFLTDGPPVELRAFVSALLRSVGVEPPTATVPFWVVRSAAWLTEATWKVLRKTREPPLSRSAIQLFGREVTVKDDLARRELGYTGHKSRAEGLAEMGASLS